MFLKINKFQIKKTNQILTNNYIRFQFLNNKLVILSNPSKIDIIKLLNQNYINIKYITMQFLNKKDTTLLIKTLIITFIIAFVFHHVQHSYHMNKYKQTVVTNNY